MGFKLSLIMFVLMCAMGGGAYWYYNDTQERMAILVANEAKATFAAKEAEAAKVVLQESYKKIAAENEKLNVKFQEAENRSKRLQNKLSRHDIGVLGVAKPELTENVLNGGSNNALRCAEIISGAPLLESEIQATKPSEINSECYELANPNFDPSIQSEAWKKKNL
jgi:hypothetical protein